MSAYEYMDAAFERCRRMNKEGKHEGPCDCGYNECNKARIEARVNSGHTHGKTMESKWMKDADRHKKLMGVCKAMGHEWAAAQIGMLEDQVAYLSSKLGEK